MVEKQSSCSGGGTIPTYKNITIQDNSVDCFTETESSNLHCIEGFLPVCLPLEHKQVLAVGCAKNLCIPANECAIWVTTGSGFGVSFTDKYKCPNCPHHGLAEYKKYPECLKVRPRNSTTENVTKTWPTPENGSSGISPVYSSVLMLLPLLLLLDRMAKEIFFHV
ncbi:uncharacterized protein LOC134234422 [Saccostrea cucullata]|uniref:uncharacterized protein LOC134234422 n=1 Tax=Saccostrea cuccullata TaxID=36930 RepID=UPI002ED1462C